jgi:hypothetical protein
LPAQPGPARLGPECLVLVAAVIHECLEGGVGHLVLVDPEAVRERHSVLGLFHLKFGHHEAGRVERLHFGNGVRAASHEERACRYPDLLNAALVHAGLARGRRATGRLVTLAAGRQHEQPRDEHYQDQVGEFFT